MRPDGSRGPARPRLATATCVALALGLALACTERGHVVVLVEEPGAELWVDGAPGGAIGAEGFELEAGPHRVEVKAEGYEPWSAEVEVRAARPAVLEVDLVGLAGALIVRSNVSGDTVWIDDKPVGPSGPHVHELPSGPHVVRVERPGYTPFVQEVEIEPEQTLTVEATLVGVGGRPPAAVHLEVVPVPVPAPVYAPRPPYYGPRPPRPPMPRPPRFP